MFNQDNFLSKIHMYIERTFSQGIVTSDLTTNKKISGINVFTFTEY